MKSLWIRALCAVLLMGVLAAACAAPAALPSTATAAPTRIVSLTSTPVEIAAVDFEGNPVQLSDYRGSVVLINFWASWCVPCKAEMPILEAYYEEHAEDGFVLIGLNSGESVEVGAQFLQENGLDFPAWSDPSGNLLIDMGINGLPFSIVVDTEGRRVARWFGEADRARLDAVITPLLEKP